MTPALLFPAISLLLLAYTNRFVALASLVRKLHEQYKKEQGCCAANTQPSSSTQACAVYADLRSIQFCMLRFHDVHYLYELDESC
jgi:hypothetical protein